MLGQKKMMLKIYAAFFAKDGMSTWNDAYGEKLLDFICHTYGEPGHYTVLQPYYYATGWKYGII